MANIKIEIQTEEAREFLAIAQMLNTLGASVPATETKTSNTDENIFARKNREAKEQKATETNEEKVTVTDTTSNDEAPEETAEEKRKRERRERDAKRKAEKKAEEEKKNDKEDSDSDFDDSDEQADEGELSFDELKNLIRPLLSSKAKIDGGRDKIRAQFDKLGASGLGSLADDKLQEMYDFLKDL